MGRTKEGGSVVSFVIIAVVLAAVLVGGVYAIRRMTTQPDVAQTPPQPTPAAPQQPSSSNGSQANQPSASQPNQQATPSQPAPQQASAPAAQLPHTGPAELLSTIIALGALSMASVAYVRSRRLYLQF